MTRTFDFIIVGNGAVGMTLARALAKVSAPARMAIVGPPGRPGSASLTAGAMINVWAEMEAGGLDDPALAARFSLPRHALELWDAHGKALAEESGHSIPISWGTYVVNGSRGPVMEERAFEYMIDSLRRAGLPCELVSPRDLGFLAADVMSRPLRAAKIPDGYVDSRKVVEALETILRRLPACELVEASATQLIVEPSGDKLVRLSEGDDLRSKIVVLANGAYAQLLVDGVPALKNSVPRLLFGGGSALDITFPPAVRIPPELRDLGSVVRTLDRGGGCGMHLIPHGNGAFYFGASSGIWLAPENLPRVHAINVLLSGLRTEFNHAFFHAQLAVRGPGFRPVTLDTFPLLGESEVRGVWFCNGTKRDGFTCAPFLAREMAEALVGRYSELPDLFRPSRPLISYRNREQAIEAAVQARMGSELMHGLVLPTYRWDDWSAQHRKQVTAIYERRGIVEFGIHPELTHFYESDEWYEFTAHPRDRR